MSSYGKRRRQVFAAAVLVVAVGCSRAGAPTLGAAQMVVDSNEVSLEENAAGTIERVLEVAAPEGADKAARLAFSADGSRIAYGDIAGGVWVFDVETGAELFASSIELTSSRWLATDHEEWGLGRGAGIRGLSFADGGATLVAVIGEGVLRAYDLTQGTVTADLELPYPVAAFDLAPDASGFAIGTPDGGVYGFSFPAGLEERSYRSADAAGVVSVMSYSSDGAALYSCLYGYHVAADADADPAGTTTNAGLTRWEVATGVREVRYAVAARQIHEAADGTLYASTCDHPWRHFDGAGQLLGEGPVRGLVLGRLAIDGRDDTIVNVGARHFALHDTVDGSGVARCAIPRPALGVVSFGATEGRIGVGFHAGGFAIYRYVPSADSAPRVVVKAHVLGTALGATVSRSRDLLFHTAPVLGLAVSPSGDYLASRDIEGRVALWDLTAGAFAASVPVAVEAFDVGDLLAFSPSGSLLYGVQADGTILTVSLPDFGTTTLTVHTDEGASLAATGCWALDESRLVVGTVDRALYVVDAADGAIVRAIVDADESGMADAMASVLVLSDSLLATPGSDHRFAGPRHGIKVATASWLVMGTLTGVDYGSARLVTTSSESYVGIYERELAPSFLMLRLADLSLIQQQESLQLVGGCGPVGPSRLLGVGAGTLKLIDWNDSGVMVGEIPHGLGRARCLVTHEAAARAFLALDSGTIVELAVD